MSQDIFKSLLDDLSRKFKSEIERGVKEGLSSDQIGKNLQAKYGGFKNKITQSTIARTLLHAAYSKGAMFDTIDDPFVVAYEFYNPDDMRTSKICHHLAGKIIRKEDIAKYTPPLHWGCRSILIPIFDNDEIDRNKIVTPKMEKGDKFKKNVVDQIDPEFTDYMGVNKMLDEMKRNKDAQAVDNEATMAKTNIALDHLRVGMDTERMPGNTTGADDYIAKEVLNEIARREVTVDKRADAKSYLDDEPELKGLYDAYKNNRIGDVLEKKDARKTIDATDRVGRDILKNEATRKFNESANADEMLDFFLEESGGGILPEDLKKKISDAIQRRAWDPMFLNPTLADLRRKAEAVVMRQGGDIRQMSESDRAILNSYFDEFFRSIDRGANVRITNPDVLDAEILRIISQHPEYKNITDRLYGHILTFQETARNAVLRQLDNSIDGVTADPLEQNIIKNKIKLADFFVHMDNSLKTVNDIKAKINKKVKPQKGVGAAADNFENNLNKENIRIAKPLGKPIISDEDFGVWVDQVASEKMKRGRAEVIGKINEKILDKLSEKGIELSTDELVIEDGQIIHLLRTNKQNRNQAISLDSLKKIKEVIANPETVLWDSRDPAIIFITSGNKKDEKIKFVLKINQFIKTNEGKKFTNSIVTAGIIQEFNSQEKRYEEIIKE
ncbi:MAG TPA: minor capsid protein [Candidatus Wallbacteria bacterium]|nr:minor capsid protein [Candidatus Wallbacteria bacterium]